MVMMAGLIGLVLIILFIGLKKQHKTNKNNIDGTMEPNRNVVKTNSEMASGDTSNKNKKVEVSSKDDLLDVDILDNLSLEKLQIDMIKNLYLEDSHIIEVLPDPETPVMAQINFKDIRQTQKKRTLIYQQWPGGSESAVLLKSDMQIDRVDDEKKYAFYNNKEYTIATYTNFLGQKSHDIPHDVNIRNNTKGKLYQDNHSEILDQKQAVVDEITKLDTSNNIENVLRFPLEPIKIGQEIKISINETIDDIPLFMKEKNPLTLNIKAVRRVLFDGRECIEFHCNQIGYSKAELSTLKSPIYSKSQMNARYYVEMKTGDILWQELRNETIESTVSKLAGGVTTLRSEAYQ
jgi:hypothetical protein